MYTEIDDFLFARSYFFLLQYDFAIVMPNFHKALATDKVIFLYVVMFFLKNLKF